MILMLIGITDPRYRLTKSGCLIIASDIGQKIIPFLSSSPLKVVATKQGQKLHLQLP